MIISSAKLANRARDIEANAKAVPLPGSDPLFGFEGPPVDIQTGAGKILRRL
jgi:hypothetical protein